MSRARAAVACAALAVAACGTSERAAEDPPERASAERAPGGVDADLVDVRSLAPSIHAEIRYAGSDNFVGAPVDGYEASTCLLARPAAEALASVHARLAADGLGLIVYDCYRPQRAVDHFVRWARDTADTRTKAGHYPRVPKSRLFDDGYIAERSGHSRAGTVDLTIGRLCEGAAPEPLDMGTPYDFFDPRSHTESPEVTAAQRANRFALRAAMDAGGFRNYEAEWWHYTLRDEPYPDTYFDVIVE